MRRSCHDASGFSLVELLIASALLLVVMSTIFQALHPANGLFQTEPERADVQQRLRVALSVLTREISQAGAGVSFGAGAGPLDGFVAPILPYRTGRRNPDPAGTFREDAITILQVDRSAAQTTLAQPFAARSGTASINIDPGCPSLDPSCGFDAGATVLVVGRDGHFDLFTVTNVQGPLLTLQHNTRDSASVYPAGSPIVQAVSRTFYLKTDPSNDLFQLTRYDGDGGNDVPIVDHIVSLSFQYRAEPEPPAIVKPLTESIGPWTSYGPRPPDAGVQSSAYPPGENCLFTIDGASNPLPRLTSLGAGPLVDLTPTQLTDGPWCADATDPNRFDADLLRIRAVVLTVRVEAAAPFLRGSAGPLFLRPGTSLSATRMVPDQEATIEVGPGNLNPGR